MPCPHYRIKISTRSKGQSAVAQAAYQSGDRLFDERSQRTKHYSDKRGIVYTEILLSAIPFVYIEKYIKAADEGGYESYPSSTWPHTRNVSPS